MKPAEIGSLVSGLLVVIGIAIGLGQYPRLERWAREQAIEAMEWKQGLGPLRQRTMPLLDSF